MGLEPTTCYLRSIRSTVGASLKPIRIPGQRFTARLRCKGTAMCWALHPLFTSRQGPSSAGPTAATWAGPQ
jgi:hypothetical protein